MFDLDDTHLDAKQFFMKNVLPFIKKVVSSSSLNIHKFFWEIYVSLKLRELWKNENQILIGVNSKKNQVETSTTNEKILLAIKYWN